MNSCLFINGHWCAGAGEEMLSHNPADGTCLWQGHAASPRQGDEAVRSAVQAFERWRALPFGDRARLVQTFAERLDARRGEMERLISSETGKPLWDARGEVAAMVGKAAISCDAYHERTGQKGDTVNGIDLRTTHRAHGVMLVLGPFNFPGHLPNGHIIPALLAGNTIIFKPSEQTPAVAELMVIIWQEAGLPSGVLNLVQGGADLAETLVRHPDVNGVLFTGGVKAGLAIHRALAGQPQKLLALELGGNNPVVAWDFDDVESVARLVVRSAFISSGQRCTCARRLLVPDGDRGQALIDALVSLMGKLSVGHPLSDQQPFMGCLISEVAAQTVLSAQDDLLKAGAVALRSSQCVSPGSAFLSPGLIDVTAIESVDEEIFGPLLQVRRVASFDEAIAHANTTQFGLATALFSDNEALFQPFLDRVHAGIVNINQPTAGASGRAPFGGAGLSGNHRPAGYYAADYCAYPVASMMKERAEDQTSLPGETI